MTIIELKERHDISGHSKLSEKYVQLGGLLRALKEKELPLEIIASVNQDIETLNASTLSGDALTKLVQQKQAKIIKLLEKALKIVPRNYYRNLWLAVGMSVFGLPIGVAIGVTSGNMGLLAVGLPIGMGIGILVGSEMDKKAFTEGRQLDIEIK
jgi:hypothetical protein